MQKLIAQLIALGLQHIPANRKIKTGVNAFFDPTDGIRYSTHSHGMVRRQPKWQPVSQSQINKTCNYLVSGFKTRRTVPIMTEEERLQFLIDYIKRKRKRQGISIKPISLTLDFKERVVIPGQVLDIENGQYEIDCNIGTETQPYFEIRLFSAQLFKGLNIGINDYITIELYMGEGLQLFKIVKEEGDHSEKFKRPNYFAGLENSLFFTAK